MNNIYVESLWMAWDAVKSNKLRSLLTMLGIIIGITAVIVLLGLGFGIQDRIEGKISGLGSNIVAIHPGSRSKYGSERTGALESLSYKDYLAIKKLPNIKNASPLVHGQYVAVNGNKNWNTDISGVNSEYITMTDQKLIEGRLWTEKEYVNRERVVVLGKTVANNLFGEISPIGKKIRVNNMPFTVIGVLEPKGLLFGFDQDDRILAPFSTVQERIVGIDYLNAIVLTYSSIEVMPQVEVDVTNLLRAKHRLIGSADNDFTIMNSRDLMNFLGDTTQMLTLFLGSIASISLLVGGIGIMNIMLVSVTERTREIGIRKALGATYNMIVAQFLIEAIFISLSGGIIGMVLGVSATKLVGLLTGIKTVIYFGPIIGSFIFSVAVGLVFGLYPAQKAAKLNPIDALHYE
ncbi:MAG: ABC transporter permease [Dialister micraerophilus]|uniref:ABC transporter permease n=1 Tax=Dialister micraerophilus TaxID=309120 RepID=UPI00254BFD4F|nr:ABC transporter permease [Dialister micraerophilus]MDK8253776.1 ABC transporter permease [Dialister micraerophilus]